MRGRRESPSRELSVPVVDRPAWAPVARFDQLQQQAYDEAERVHKLEAHQRSRGVRMAGAIAVIVGVGSFITALWYKEGDLIIAMTVLLVLGGVLGMRTRKPAAQVVRETAAKLLTDSLDRYRRQQLSASDFYHAEAWQALRRSVLERGEARCVRCGRKASAMLVVEHIRPRSEAPDDALDPENVQILCHACKNEQAMRTGTC